MEDKHIEIEKAIEYIHQNIYEPLSLDELASYVAYSPYHFSRIFKKKIGISPLYYVSSVRLQKAKDLLLSTNLSIRDIGMEIGQQSLGTFTTRFTERVGMTPAQFRNSRGEADSHLQSLKQLHRWQEDNHTLNHNPNVNGTIDSELPLQGVILVGLFAKPIPEGLPLYGTLLPAFGDFCFSNVKTGTYYLMVTSVSWGMKSNELLLPNSTLRGRIKDPIVVKPFTPVAHQHVMLHPPRLDDPPILISLPLLMNNFLNRMRKYPSTFEKK
ncbi:helix-turn-helix transcriptional regulator [Evansella halocellulosilytica]|uniref:helix-turn-helix transcriptional regulator n=1 Tax=Evansella halocellulosilytica TaxID=2011013 RepID=UPI000BB9AA0E|nr:AraC family transcriptional regulator [Evansella halocellulosilytica]